LTQILVESCVDFEVAHLSVFMVWRLPYPEVPTLSCGKADLSRARFSLVDWKHVVA